MSEAVVLYSAVEVAVVTGLAAIFCAAPPLGDLQRVGEYDTGGRRLGMGLRHGKGDGNKRGGDRDI